MSESIATTQEKHELDPIPTTFQVISNPNIDPSNSLFRQYDDIRVEWVQNIYKWLPSFETDVDRLDVDDATTIIGVVDTEQDGSETLMSAMRLTPIISLNEALSWDMINIIAPEESDDIESSLMSLPGFSEALLDGRVYDITRAFPNYKKLEESERAMLQLFGASIGFCDLDQEGRADPTDYYWLFTPNRAIKLFLARHDIPFIEINNQQEDERKSPTIMVVDMKSSYYHVAHETPHESGHDILVDATHSTREKLII